MSRLAVVALAAAAALAPAPQPAAVPGLTAAPAVARAYDTILDADFAGVPARLADACGAAPAEICRVLDAVAEVWAIQLEPESRIRDPRFTRLAEAAIAAATAWTRREPARAEAWFYLGAAYGAQVQWKVLRGERLGAARDGKAVRGAMERALALDPALHDANFGLGLYRYYAATAPAVLRMFRWLFLLPGGDRDEGLRLIADARANGRLVRDEADFQLHRIYLWYESRAGDALAIVRGLQQRHPANPLFHHLEAEILDEYFHDAAASLDTSTRLLALARDAAVHEPRLAAGRARLNIAAQLHGLGRDAEAVAVLDAILEERPSRPYGVADRARALRARIRR